MSERRRTPQVKNKTAAPVQITAEQVIREAMEHQESDPKAPRQKITDAEELSDFRLRKRKEFEDQVHRQRGLISMWLKYAAWEESQREFERARNVYERAIDVDYRNVSLWLKYAEMEMKHKNINHARNIWDRAVTLLPRMNQLWFKYVYMEDILGNYAGARQIFERWMKWEPDEQAWNSYIKFELRNREVERARDVFRRFVRCHPTVPVWVRFAKFEEKQGEIQNARQVYEEAIEYLGDLANDERLFIAFADFEERVREYERARAIYKYALDHLPKSKAQDLYKRFIAFEKQHGNRNSIEEVILSKRRFHYEEELKHNPMNYDVWFDYIRLEESHGDVERIREVFERAIANVPPSQEKRFWRRYIYLWINYALHEELDAEDAGRAREVYKACVRLIPHKTFSFSKVWLLYAQFELRQGDVSAARSVLGHALGMAGKEKIFQEYIQLELQLGEVDRCRELYGRYLQSFPSNCRAWLKFAELEKHLNEIERARGIFELAIEQPQLDMPELVWKAYIDFETELEQHERTAELYKRLLERTKHVKVWISYAQFRRSLGDVAGARAVYTEAHAYLKKKASSATPDEQLRQTPSMQQQHKEERVLLVQSWKEFEDSVGEPEAIEHVARLLPKRIKKKRPIQTQDGTSAGWEEYYDYIFPDELSARPNLKILERAHQWKKEKAVA